jgi:hypothetical protein
LVARVERVRSKEAAELASPWSILAFMRL